MTTLRDSNVARRRGVARLVARCIAAAAMIGAIAVPASAWQQADTSPQELLGQAMHQETGVGDLVAAISLYERVVAHGSVDIGTRLQAELRLAGLLAKTGDTAAARELFERIVASGASDAAHDEVVVAAREALGALGEVSPAPQDRVRLSEPADILALSMGGTRRSPDGRYGVFTNYADSYNVVVFDYDTEQLTWLTDFATLADGHADLAVWAPDSRGVAYAVAGQDGFHEIRVFEPGETPRTVYRTAAVDGAYFTARPTSWAPDGRSLAVLLDNGDESNTVGILDVASGEVAQLATFAWSRDQTNGPQFSPDGRHLVLTRPVDGNNELYSLAVDGSRMTRLTDDPGNDAWPLWSRDGSHVLFTSNRLGQKGLWAIPMEAGVGSAAPMLLDRSFPAFRAMTWVGDRLSYLERNYPRDVYTVPVDAASGEATGPARKIAYTPSGANVSVAWSRDGKLAFFSFGRPGDDKVVVVFPDGTTSDFRIPSPGFGGTLNSLQFDAAGKVVSFANTRGRMASVDIESGGWSEVMLPDDSGPCCVLRAPQPDTVFYVTRSLAPPWHIRRLDLQTGETTAFFELDAELAASPRMRLSPDGTRMWLPGPRSFTQIDLASARVEERIELDDAAPASCCTGDWGDLSPDGRMLALVADDELRVLDIERGELHGLGVRLDQLFAGLPQNPAIASIGQVRWSPDGSRIAFETRFMDIGQWTIEDPLVAVSSDTGSR